MFNYIARNLPLLTVKTGETISGAFVRHGINWQIGAKAVKESAPSRATYRALDIDITNIKGAIHVYKTVDRINTQVEALYAKSTALRAEVGLEPMEIRRTSRRVHQGPTPEQPAEDQTPF